jgi:signal transduction histidine kinase
MGFICTINPLILLLMKQANHFDANQIASYIRTFNNSYLWLKLSMLSLFIGLFGHVWAAPQNDSLPEVPWKTIVEMVNQPTAYKWGDDIYIKLIGNHTPSDSLMVLNAMHTLNEISETVKFSMSPYNQGNLDIYFVDSTNEKTINAIFDVPSTISLSRQVQGKGGSTDSINHISKLSQLFRLTGIPDSSKQNYIINTLATDLFPNSLNIYKYWNGKVYDCPASIFNNQSVGGFSDYYKPINDFDKEILKAVYAKDFETILPLARKQYRQFEFPLWVRQNSLAVLIFPFVLVLFLMVGVFIWLHKKLFVRINHRWFKFNVISTLALITLAVVLWFFIAFSNVIIESRSVFHFDSISLLASLIISTAIGLPAVNIFWLIEKVIHKNTHRKYLKTLMLFLSTSLIPSFVVSAFVYFSIRGIRESGQYFNENDYYRTLIYLVVAFVVIATIRALISFFILKEKEIKIENEVKLANLRELKTKAELNALHSKINPHFLYNSLNSIAGLAKTDANKTEHMALLLSKLFRYAINKEQSDWSTLAEELEMATIYLEIEKIRFDDKLTFTIDLPSEMRDMQIPRFMIQPLVENAIKHGISQMVTKGEVGISIRKSDQGIEISVNDNGPDFPSELNTGFGLQGIYDKLEILYPNRFELHFLNSPNKQIIIKLW